MDTRPDGSVVTIGPADGWNGYTVCTSDGFVSVNMMPKGRKWTLKSATLSGPFRSVEGPITFTIRWARER